MTGDAWRVGSSTSDHRPSQETRPPHETALLHEVIIQAVTERRVDIDPDLDYDKQLESTIKSIRSSDGYKALLARHDASQADVSALLDHQHLERLPTVDSAHHVTLMMATGGPATGKSSIIKNLQQNYPTTFRDAAKINPDDYKPLLADRGKYGKAYADVSHAESSRLAADIMVRLEEKMAAGRAPNIVMDVVATSEHRMNFAKQAGQLVVVTGTAPLEVTVPRAYERGLPEDGRRIPTKVVIEGARNVAIELPRVFEHPAVRFEIVDTNVPFGTPIKTVAYLEKRTSTLKITNPDTFIDLIERQNVNVNAQSPTELFRPENRTPETIARDMKAYTDRGIKLDFLNPQGEVAMTVSHDGVEQIRPLASQRGQAFFPALVIASRAAIGGDASHSKPQEIDEHRTTTPPAESEHLTKGLPLPTRVGTVSAGLGTALGAKGIYDDLHGQDSRLKHDLHAGGAQATVGGARFLTQVADFTIGAAATVEGTHRALSRSSETLAGIAPKIAEFGPAMKLAGRAAIPLAVAAGTLEATAGVIEHNPKRVAAAVGSTGGGIAGGIIGGVIAGAAFGFVAGGAAGSETGPGALITAGVGALGGAIWGGMVGEDQAKKHLTGAVDKVMHLFDHQPTPQHTPTPAHVTSAHPAPTQQPHANLSPEMLRALSMAKGAGISQSLQCDAHHLPSLGNMAAAHATAPACKPALGR